MLAEFLDTYSEGLGLCLSNPRLPSERAEGNGHVGCPILAICSGWLTHSPGLC